MKREKVTFAAGCFWHVEYDLKKIKGVLKTSVGYMGGDKKKYPNPTYKEVSSGKTGFLEVCRAEYNPEKVKFKELLQRFWKIHNPTELNRQGRDIGTQYNSVIFYYNKEQKKEAEESREKEQRKYKEKIVTKIKKAEKFYKAEEYHQDYFNKNDVELCRV